MFRKSMSLFALLLSALQANADNWPAWRGADGQGVCKEKNLPLKWSASENVAWKVPLPDQGNSTPVIWGDRIFLTQATEKGTKRSTICVNKKDGSKLWEKTVEYKEVEPTHATNPYCSASAATDGEIVVVSHGSAGVFCYSLDGKELWNRDLGKCHHIWGNAASPVLWKDRVFLNFGPGPRTSLIAMNKKDGKEIWKVEEPGGLVGNKGETWIGSWSTPVIATINGREELVMTWPGAIKSHDPKTGEVFWSCKGLDRDKAGSRLVYTSPLVANDFVVAMSGYGGPAIAAKTVGKGDVTETHRLWRHPGNPQRIGSGIILGEHIYMMNEPGTFQCIEAKSGKILFTERVGSGVWGNLVLIEDKFYVTNLEGETYILAAKPKFEEIARNHLKERTLASIAASDGRLYIRTYKHLWCISNPK